MEGTQEILVQLATIAGDVRAVLGRLDRHDQGYADHESRLRSLEQWRWVATGLAAAGGGVVGTALSSALQLTH